MIFDFLRFISMIQAAGFRDKSKKSKKKSYSIGPCMAVWFVLYGSRSALHNLPSKQLISTCNFKYGVVQKAWLGKWFGHGPHTMNHSLWPIDYGVKALSGEYGFAKYVLNENSLFKIGWRSTVEVEYDFKFSTISMCS